MLRNEGTRTYSATPEEIGVQKPRSLVCQELPRERKRWIRPPLIGQASPAEHSVHGQSSRTSKNAVIETLADGSYKSLPEYSNNWSDIQALAFQHHLQPETSMTSVSSQSLSFPLDTRMSTNNSSASTHIIGHQRRGPLTVTENACCIVHSESKVTKENKSDSVAITGLLDSGATNEEISATVPESPNARAPSPASVSSVTSSRRLEWDSGADVGYLAYQISDEISISGHDMSTIERIALAQGCSTALSMRLDPEGTICSGQQSSTMLLLSNHMKGPKSGQQVENSKILATMNPTKMKYVTNSFPMSAESESEATSSSPGNRFDHEDSSVEESNNILQRVSNDKNGEFLSAPKEQQHENAMQVKKLSSSLSGLNELDSQNLKDSNVLHRSQSQNSVSQKCSHNSYASLLQKNSNVITNSLSSSSLATVVSKRDYRKTSNKHTQTSPHASIKQPVVVEVYDVKYTIEPDSLDKNDKSFQSKHSYFEHAGSTDHSEMILEKTFDTELNIDASVAISKRDIAKAVASEQLKTAFQKRTVQSACQEMINSLEDQDGTEAETLVMHREVTNVKTSPRNTSFAKHIQPTNEVQNLSPGVDNNLQGKSSWFLNDGTLIEKNKFDDTSQRGSMDAIDSAQSFEYFSGHAFENMKKITLNKNAIEELPSSAILQDNLDVTSSESSASNTFAKDLDRIVTQVTSYLNDRPHSNSEKKKLVQKIVKQLLETKYTDDSSSKESHGATKHRTPATSHDNGVPEERSNKTLSIKESDLNNRTPQKVMQHADSEQEFYDQTPVHLSDKCIGTDDYGKKRVCGPARAALPPRREAWCGAFLQGQHEATFEAFINFPTIRSRNKSLSRHTLSEESALLSSTSQSPALEAPMFSNTVYTTGPISTSTSTSCKSNSSSWKRRTVQLEKEYELCKQNQKPNNRESVLLKFCKTERENQLAWICTEIRHLKRLKQLLDDQEKLLETMENKTKFQGVKDKYVKPLYSSPVDTRSTKTSDENSKRFLEISSTTSTEQEIQSTEKRSANLNICRSREMYKVFALNAAKAHRKHNREGKYLHMKSSGSGDTSKIQDQISISKEYLLEKPSMCTQKYIEKLREEIKTKISKNKAVQTSLRSSSSSSFKTYVMSEKSEDRSSSGRINMYFQTKDKTSSSGKLREYETSESSQTKDKSSSSGKLKEYKASESFYTKNKISSSGKLKEYKTSDSLETHKFNSEMPLCCCECKKLCEEFKRKLIEINKPDTVKQSKCKCVQVVSHEADDDKLSSYGTLNDAAELTKDSECHAQINSLKESRSLKKAENASVQTTLSFKETFVRISDVSNPRKNEQKNSENDTKQTDCLCHKLIRNGFAKDLQSQTQIQHLDQMPAVQQESLKDKEKLSFDSDGKNNYHKAKELKTKGGHTSKKCATCSASISESPRSDHTRGNQLCNSCYQKALPSSSTSIRNSSDLPNKESIAYILTLESGSEISIPQQTARKELKEIVMKVPMKKTQTYASGNKKSVKQKKTGSMSKENHRPKHKMCHNNSENSETTNGVKNLTLQEYLMINRPDFIQNAEERRSCLEDLAHMRELHQKYKRERLAMAAHVNSTAMKNMKDLPRPPLAVKRVFSQRTLRAQTEQKYRKLPEMQVKNVERKKKEEFRTNRLMAQIFAKKLQKKALRGEVSLSNSKSVISTL